MGAFKMDEAALNSLTDRAFSVARATIESHGYVKPVIILRKSSGKDVQFTVPGDTDDFIRLLREKRFSSWMHRVIRQHKPEATALVASEAVTELTDEGRRLNAIARDTLLSERGQNTGVALGFMVKQRVITVTIQSPEGALLFKQPFTVTKGNAKYGERSKEQLAKSRIEDAIRVF